MEGTEESSGNRRFRKETSKANIFDKGPGMESSLDRPADGCLSLRALLLCPHRPSLNLLDKKSKWKPGELLIHQL